MSKLINEIFVVPLFDVPVMINVSEDIKKERSKYNNKFGYIVNDYNALCSYSGRGDFALFFQSDSFDLETVAHEIFHLTHRILEWAGIKFDINNHEIFAILCGSLMRTTIQILRKNKCPNIN